MNKIEFIGNNPNIGLVTRNSRAGPESELVEKFKNYIPACFKRRRGDFALFYEPKMETGFPDLVVVQYIPEIFYDWSPQRSYLKPRDIKIIHHLFNTKGAKKEHLSETLGLSMRMLLSSIERLHEAKMIVHKKENWLSKPLNAIYGVQIIIAIEAKISNWQQAFEQSLLNRWFSSEAYILSPVEKPSDIVVDRANRTGVGVLLLNGTKVRIFQNPLRNRLPVSYGSWIFNEWIGRYLNR